MSEHASRSQGKKMYETRFWYSCLLTITSSQNYFVKITWKGSSLSFYLSIILNNFWVILWDEILETQKMRIWTVDTRQNERKLKKRKNYAFNNSNKFFSSISYFFRRQKHLFFEMICQVTCPCSNLKQFLFFNQSWEDTCEHPHQLIFCFHRSFILKGGRFVWATGSHSLLVLAVWCVWSRSNHQLRIHFSGDPTWYVAAFFLSGTDEHQFGLVVFYIVITVFCPFSLISFLIWKSRYFWILKFLLGTITFVRLSLDLFKLMWSILRSTSLSSSS